MDLQDTPFSYTTNLIMYHGLHCQKGNFAFQNQEK